MRFKKMSALAATLALCLCLGACAPRTDPAPTTPQDTLPATNTEAAPTTPKPEPPPNLPQLPEDYGLLAEMVKSLGNAQTHLSIFGNLSDSVHFVEDTGAFRLELAQILVDGQAQIEAIEPLTSSISTQSSLMFNLRDSDTAAQMSIDFSLADTNDANIPNKAYLGIFTNDNREGCYLVDKEIFLAVEAVVNAHTKEIRVDIEGEHTLLRPAQDAADAVYRQSLLLDDIFVCNWYDQMKENALSYHTVETFRLSTGKQLSRQDFEEQIFRIKQTDSIVGYDYLIFLADGVLCKNSADATQEKKIPLPAGVQPVPKNVLRNLGAFDVEGDKLVWTDDSGVHLAQTDGSNAQLLALPAAYLGANGAYDEPRFLLEGSKIAVSIYDTSDAGECSYLGMVLIDTASGESQHYFREPAHGSMPVYPIADRYFTMRQGNYTTMADAQTGETKVIHSADAPAPIFAGKNPGGQNSPHFTLDSYDFQTLILAQSPLQQGTTIFAGDATATRTLATIPAPCFARLDAVLQTHAVLSGTDIDGSWLALLPY